MPRYSADWTSWRWGTYNTTPTVWADTIDESSGRRFWPIDTRTLEPVPVVDEAMEPEDL